MIWGAALNREAKATPKPFTASLTNWGNLPFQAVYGAAGGAPGGQGQGQVLRLLGVEPAVNMAHTTYPIVIASTVLGKLTLSLVTVHQVIPESTADRLLARIQSLLVSMAESEH